MTVALLLCQGFRNHAGYLDEHGTPRDFATRPNGGTATLLSLTQVQRAMAKIASMEKQKHAAPARSSAPKRPRPRSPSPELDISDDDEPEGAQCLWKMFCSITAVRLLSTASVAGCFVMTNPARSLYQRLPSPYMSHPELCGAKGVLLASAPGFLPPGKCTGCCALKNRRSPVD